MSLQGGETRLRIGMRLRAGRERKGLTILQAAEKLHVDAKILESLESEDFAALGAPVYVRGHMRHYAELVSEPATELLGLYSNSTLTTPPDLTKIAKGQASSDPRRLVIPAVVVIIGFAIAGAVWWVLSISKGQPRTARTSVSTSASPVAATSSSAAAAASTAPPSTIAATTPAPVTTPRPGEIAGPSLTQAAAAPRAAAAIPTALTMANPATRSPTDGALKPVKPQELTLRFTGESWAEVYDSAGVRLFYDVGAANSVRTFKGAEPMRIVLGNAPGVAVEVNGHAANIASVTHSDGSAQFVVNRSGRASQARP